MAKVIRKEAWHTQRRDQASGIFINLELQVNSFSERNGYGGELPVKYSGFGGR